MQQNKHFFRPNLCNPVFKYLARTGVSVTGFGHAIYTDARVCCAALCGAPHTIPSGERAGARRNGKHTQVKHSWKRNKKCNMQHQALHQKHDGRANGLCKTSKPYKDSQCVLASCGIEMEIVGKIERACVGMFAAFWGCR